MERLSLSKLGHTWIIDIDGTIVKHNGYKEGEDELLSGVKEFFAAIPEKDMIILITSRTEEYRDVTKSFLDREKIRYDHLIFNAPYGERILLNDDKPSGMKTAYSLSVKRDDGLDLRVIEDSEI